MTRITLFLVVPVSFYLGACNASREVLLESTHTKVEPTVLVNLEQGTQPYLATNDSGNQHIFVSFTLDQTGDVVNPVVTQQVDEGMKKRAIHALNHIQFEPARIEMEPTNIELTMPVSFRGQDKLPDLSDFVDQIPILLGSMESLIKDIQYPERARRANLEGRVTIAFIVDVNGYARFPTVTESLGAGCDEAALRAVRLARFSPGQLNGIPVNVVTSMTFVFTLT